MKYFKQMSMFMLMLLCSMTSLAYDFEVDGIYYNIIDLDSKTVEVTHNGKNNVFFRIVVHSGVTSWLEDFMLILMLER